jgi:gamma-glutamylcyclotransferase (GGCT)/AIG2-like uncharacterized protein YtfP
MKRLRLFVYGTLQPVAQTRMGRWIEERCVSAGEASAAGRIFAVRGGNGWFPALVPAQSPRRVSGMCCELELRPGELALLDRYEGVEYRRVALPVRLADGRLSPAQAYLWRIALPGDARPIPSGDFLEWLRDNRLSAFSTLRNGA